MGKTICNRRKFLQYRECFARMNFLYQASFLMAGKNNALSSLYGKLCRRIAQKAVVKMHPDVKRYLCKRCAMAQKLAVTADLDIKILQSQQQPQQKQQSVVEAAENIKQHKKSKVKLKKSSIDIDKNVYMQLKCRICDHVRQFRVNPKYDYWFDNPKSLVRVISTKSTTTTEAAETATTTSTTTTTAKNQ